MCGEKENSFEAFKRWAGSPPHVRGKDNMVVNRFTSNRITPACAGKSPGWPLPDHRSWDHPRMCGEKLFQHGSSHWGLGSPPHVRGKVAQHNGAGGVIGITPACAGKSSDGQWVLYAK